VQAFVTVFGEGSLSIVSCKRSIYTEIELGKKRDANLRDHPNLEDHLA
jgi:hypothetical protein